MPDAKSWEKVAENIVKTRNWLYQIQQDDSISRESFQAISNIRFLLMVALEQVDKLARYDNEGWL